VSSAVVGGFRSNPTTQFGGAWFWLVGRYYDHVILGDWIGG
jgi:hypothetical protein